MKVGREYIAYGVKHLSDNKYTTIKVKDSQKQKEGGWNSVWYKLFITGNVNVIDEDTIIVKAIKDVVYEEREYMGKVYNDITIFVDEGDIEVKTDNNLLTPSQSSFPFGDENLKETIVEDVSKAPWD